MGLLNKVTILDKPFTSWTVSKKHEKYIYIFDHFLTLIWHMLLKYFFVEIYSSYKVNNMATDDLLMQEAWLSLKKMH